MATTSLDARKAEIIEGYNRERDALLDLIKRITPAVWEKPSPCPGWSCKDLVAHITTSAVNLSLYVNAMLEGKRLNPTRADLDARNEQGVRDRRGRSIDELTAELTAAHQRNIEHLLSLTEAQLGVTGALSSGAVVTVEERFRRAGGHYREHGGMVAQVAGLGAVY